MIPKKHSETRYNLDIKEDTGAPTILLRSSSINCIVLNFDGFWGTFFGTVKGWRGMIIIRNFLERINLSVRPFNQTLFESKNKCILLLFLLLLFDQDIAVVATAISVVAVTVVVMFPSSVI